MCTVCCIIILSASSWLVERSFLDIQKPIPVSTGVCSCPLTTNNLVWGLMDISNLKETSTNNFNQLALVLLVRARFCEGKGDAGLS